MRDYSIFDNVYTAVVQSSAPFQPNVKQFFDGYPFLKSINVKAITVKKGTIPPQFFYLTIVDKNKNQVLYNYPLEDLLQVSNAVTKQSNIRLFNINGIDLLSSYYVSNIGWGSPSTVTLFYLNFYY